METYKILDQEYPVTGYFTAPQIGTVPLVDLPQMSDERWEDLAQENAVRTTPASSATRQRAPRRPWSGRARKLRRQSGKWRQRYD